MAGRGHVVVMGGAGYLGGHVVLALRRRGYLVTGVDDLSVGVRQHSELAQHFVRLDARDRSALHALLSNRPTAAVVHLAGIWDPARIAQDPEVAVEVDLGGTGSLLGAMRLARVPSLVLASELQVSETGGAADSGALAQGTPQGHALRARILGLIEELLALARRAWDLRPAVLRFGCLEGAEGEAGACDPRAPARSVVGRALEALEGKAATGSNARPAMPAGLDILHVSDAAAAIADAVGRLREGSVPPGPLEVGLGRLVGLDEIQSALRALTGGREVSAAGLLLVGAAAEKPCDPRAFRAWAPTWVPEHTEPGEILRSAWEAHGRARGSSGPP